jgi:hypothetical protein
MLFGRFSDHPDGVIIASFSDRFAWISSIIFWSFVAYWNYYRDPRKPTLKAIVMSQLKELSSGSTHKSPSRSISADHSSKPVVTHAQPARVGSGPFGLAMGMKPAGVGTPIRIEESVQRYSKLTNGHDLYNEYRLTFGTTIGLCHVAACKTGIDTLDRGRNLKSEFRTVVAKYQSLYGPCTERDQTVSSEFAKFISICAEWSNATGAKLPEHVKSIIITAERISDGKGEVCVDYYYTNYTAFEGTGQVGPNEGQDQCL